MTTETQTRVPAMMARERVALSLIATSLTNPRRTYPPEREAEFVGNIKQHGVLVPLIVRPHPKGKPTYELVCGERRFRAAQKAGLSEVPVEVRDLDDGQAETLQMIENLQRADLTPLEEAEGYGAMQKKGMDAKKIADAVGKHPIYVTQRLQLAGLPGPAKKALADGNMSLGVALLVARIPEAKVRADASKELLDRSRGEPISVAEARRVIADEFMLDLSRAPFDVTEALLVKEAGSCTTCPKKTGNQAALFGDIKSKELCVDPPCYQGKVKAHHAALIANAKKNGQTVISGADAKKLRPNSWNRDINGYVDLDAEVWKGSERVKVRKLLGKTELPVVLFVDPHEDKVRELVSHKDVAPHLETRERRSSSPAQRESRAKELLAGRIESASRVAIYRAMRERRGKETYRDLSTADMRVIVEACYGELTFDKRKAVALLWFPYDRKQTKLSAFQYAQEATDKIEKKFKTMTDIELGRTLVDISVSGAFAFLNAESDELEGFASRSGVNVKAVRKQTAETMKKPAAKPAAKPKAKKGK